MNNDESTIDYISEIQCVGMSVGISMRMNSTSKQDDKWGQKHKI